MAAYNPKYTVAIITKNNTKYNVTGAITKLQLKENDGEIAQHAEITLVNVEVNGSYLSGLINVRDRVYIYANDGEKTEEVFRGYVFTRPYSSSRKKELTLDCYDNLIYFQESEDYQYFSAGYSTKSVCGSICEKWGIKLVYNFESITHPKLPLRGTLADIFLTDLLAEVKKKTGKKSVMRSIQDVVHIDHVGANTTIYKLYRGKDGTVTDTNSEITMKGMITKVIILGKEDDNERAAVEDTVSKNTDIYGTLQKILSSSSGTNLAEVKTEATELIEENSVPKEKFRVTAVDIPWIHKGDKVYVFAGDMSGYFIVLSITHSYNDKTMTLEVERA